jgi:hypothetical protein
VTDPAAPPKKPYDPKKKPFMRVDSPSLPSKKQLTGDSHVRGTRRANEGPTSLGGLLFGSSGFGPEDDFLCRGWMDRNVTRRVIRTMPSWVPTEGEAPNVETDQNVELELQGTMVRSFQTWTDVPVIQYHKWYDWNFHVLPDKDYDWVRGKGNTAPHVDDPNGVAVIDGNPGVIELEWDTGAFGDYMFPSDPNPDYGKHGRAPGAPGTDVRFMGGPMFERDWAWPMTDDYIWAVGRSIYDGGHENSNKESRTELHPVKAFCTVRREGFIFMNKDKKPVHKGKVPDGSGKVPDGLAVPAHQFLFYSSIHGGYWSFKDLKPKNGKPYEFIVDLPEAPWTKGPEEAAIGPSEQVKLNTIVLRDMELLSACDRDRFDISRKLAKPPGKVDPEFKLVDELPDAKRPRCRQVNIKIPLAALEGEYYGALLTLGWRDHSGATVAAVRKVEARFKKLKTGDQDQDTFAEEWRLKGGINGRWRQFNFDQDNAEPGRGKGPKVKSLKSYDLKAPPTQEKEEFWTFFLHEDEPVRFTTHGAELDLVDDMYFKDDRTLKIKNAEWQVERQAPRNMARRAAVEADYQNRGLGTPVWTPPTPDPPTFNGGVAIWNKHIDRRPPRPERQPPPEGQQAHNDEARWQCTYPEQRAAVRAFKDLMSSTWGDENDPLGIIDADRGPPQEKKKNPLSIKRKEAQFTVTNTLTAYATWEIPPLAELAEKKHDTEASGLPSNTGDINYWVDYEVKVTKQYK